MTCSHRLRASPIAVVVVVVVAWLGLDRVQDAPWVLAVAVLAAAFLAAMALEGWGRAGRECSGVPRRRLRAMAAPLFHTGLLLVLLAGIARLLFGAEATRDALEGEEWGPGPWVFERQAPGFFAEPVSLPASVRFEALRPHFGPDGALRGLEAEVSLADGPRRLAAGAPLELRGTRLHLMPAFGPAVYLEFARDGLLTRRVAVLRASRSGDHAFAEVLRGRYELVVRASPAGPRESPPEELEVQVRAGGALLATGRLRAGEALELPGDGFVRLGAVGWWVRVKAERELPAWPFLAGVALAALGALLAAIFAGTGAGEAEAHAPGAAEDGPGHHVTQVP